MQDLINYVTSIPAASWYHMAAFVLTGAASQYSVQFIKIITNNKYGKWTLRALNGTFNTLYVAAAAIATGGIALGEDVKTILALTTVSTVIYRIHNSFLYKQGQDVLQRAQVIGVGAPIGTPTLATVTDANDLAAQ